MDKYPADKDKVNKRDISPENDEVHGSEEFLEAQTAVLRLVRQLPDFSQLL